LDKPVFQELAQCLKTKKLAAGETLFDIDSEDRDFYVVVDGEVEIMLRTIDVQIEDTDTDDEGTLHLLNKVHSGGTVTSLFSILAILSEDLEVPAPLNQSRDASKATTRGDMTPSAARINPPQIHEELFLESVVEDDTSSNADTSSATNTMDSDTVRKTNQSNTKPDSSPHRPKKKKEKPRSVHPNLTAKAACPTTLAVIPAAAFHRLSGKYPKAAAHMTHVILTRFQRVTFLTLHRYLGLSSELLAIERKINEIGATGLPTDLFSPDLIHTALWRLSHRYDEVDVQENDFGNPSDRSDYLDEDIFNRTKMYLDGVTDAKSFAAGEDDEKLKDAIFSCICHLICLTPSKDPTKTDQQNLVSESGSQSGRSIPGSTVERFYYSTRRTSTASVSTSGAIRNLLDQDTISVSSFSSGVLSEDLDCPDVEIQYFKRGEVILKEGERSEGLYYVLDGIIEASTMEPSNRFLKETSKSSIKKNVFLIQPGGIASYLAAISGNASFVTLTAKTDLLVGMMPRKVLDRYIDKYPNVLFCLAKRLVNQLSPLVFHIDVALDWGQINAGQTLCKQGCVH
jgi:lysophospholipid hydrolase